MGRLFVEKEDGPEIDYDDGDVQRGAHLAQQFPVRTSEPCSEQADGDGLDAVKANVCGSDPRSCAGGSR